MYRMFLKVTFYEITWIYTPQILTKILNTLCWRVVCDTPPSDAAFFEFREKEEKKKIRESSVPHSLPPPYALNVRTVVEYSRPDERIWHQQTTNSRPCNSKNKVFEETIQISWLLSNRKKKKSTMPGSCLSKIRNALNPEKAVPWSSSNICKSLDPV